MPDKLPPCAPRFTGSQNDLLPWAEEHHNKLGSIFQSYAYGTKVYVISEPRYIEHILRKNWQNYRKGRGIKRITLLLGAGLISSEGELWKRQRRMIQPAFHDRVIDQLTTMITEVNDTLLKKWEIAAHRKTRVNVTQDISHTVLEIILKAIFGDDYDYVAPHFDILTTEQGRDLGFAQAFRTLDHLVADVESRRKERDDESADMFGMLMRARDKDSNRPMSKHQLANEILTLVVAGHETTALTLNWIWYLLSQHPEVEEKLNLAAQSGDDTYTRQVIEEGLRLYPAIWLQTRRSINDDKLGCYFVPAKTEIYISTYLMQRRADLWPEPNRFNPDRFAEPDVTRHRLAMIPFGAGPRVCIGEYLARLEMVTHLRTIASKLRLRYSGPEPELDLGVNIRSKHDFMMLPVFCKVPEIA